MQNNNLNQFLLSLWRRKWLIFSAFFILLVVYIFSQISILKIEIEGVSGEVEVVIKNQTTQESSSFATDSSSITRVMRPGLYEVYVNQGTTNEFGVISTNGFFRQAMVSLSPKPEGSRQFIGNNPDACSYYNGNYALSYGCVSSVESIVEHTPQTTTQTTFNRKNEFGLRGTIQGIVDFKQQTAFFVVDSITKQHKFVLVDDNYKKQREINISGLDSSTFYEIRSLSGGMVIFNKFNNEIYKLSGYESALQKVTVSSDSVFDLDWSDVSVNESESFLVFRTNSDIDVQVQDPSDIVNSILVINDTDTTEFNINGKVISQIALCGDDLVCAVSEGDLEFYRIDGTSLRFEFEISGVDSVFAEQNNVFATNEFGLLNIDVENKKGNQLYRWGEYRPCGYKGYVEGLNLLCVRTTDRRSFLVAVSNDNPATNNFDQVVQNFDNNSQIKSWSLYKNSLVVLPNFDGLDLVLNSDGLFGYNPKQVQEIKNSVESSIKPLVPSGVQLSILGI